MTWQYYVMMCAGIITCLAHIPYGVSIVRGKTKPSLITWIIWAANEAIIVGSMIKAGAELPFYIVGSLIGACAIALLLIRYGRLEKEWLDVFCVALSGAGIYLWSITSDPRWALCLSLTVAWIGGAPIVVNAWQDPKSDSLFSWLCFFTAGILATIAIPQWTIQDALQPVSFVAFQILMLCLLSRRWWGR